MFVILLHYVFPLWPACILTLNPTAACIQGHDIGSLLAIMILIVNNESVMAVLIYEEEKKGLSCHKNINDNQPMSNSGS